MFWHIIYITFTVIKENSCKLSLGSALDSDSTSVKSYRWYFSTVRHNLKQRATHKETQHCSHWYDVTHRVLRFLRWSSLLLLLGVSHFTGPLWFSFGIWLWRDVLGKVWARVESADDIRRWGSCPVVSLVPSVSFCDNPPRSKHRHDKVLEWDIFIVVLVPCLL